ncbi:unnamed protein product [Caenorhabditis angaria]|uniref:glucuronosyltransferase n=1 Tax=Caenorhabditis angaria TaxID=860376 RepID=A0A9P1IU28_9PELO|nr:unnamed protein product [Caenorhabditis angaria]
MPQSALLADKRVKLFITHGGLASTMEVAYSGKPALVVPLFSDQFHNGMMLSRHKGAITYDKYELANPTKLIANVRQILETPSFLENAELLAKVLHNQPIQPKQLLLSHMEFAAKFPNLKSLVPENNFNNLIAFYYLDAYLVILGFSIYIIYLLSKLLKFRIFKMKKD